MICQNKKPVVAGLYIILKFLRIREDFFHYLICYAMGGNLLASTAFKYIFKRVINTRNLEECTLAFVTIEFTFIRYVYKSAGIDRVVGRIENTAREKFIAMRQSSKLIVCCACHDAALKFRNRYVV